MLILERNEGESIVIKFGDQVVTIKICRIRTRSRCVRIGFEAPDDVVVHRSELKDFTRNSRQVE